jgi:hypothetical protein
MIKDIVAHLTERKQNTITKTKQCTTKTTYFVCGGGGGGGGGGAAGCVTGVPLAMSARRRFSSFSLGVSTRVG